jgi:hypothetical protein
MTTIKQFLDDIGFLKDASPTQTQSTQESSEVLDIPIESPPRDTKPPQSRAHFECMKYAKVLRNERIDITKGYSQWRKIAIGLGNSFGENGRDLFHLISSAGYPAYDKAVTDNFFSGCLTALIKPGQLTPTVATVIRLAREAGAHIYKNRKRHKDENNSEVAFEIIQEKYPAVFDTLSQDVLVKGKPIDDIILNTVLVDLMVNHNVYTTKEFVQAVLESSFTETVNQFNEFVNKYYHKATFNNDNIENLATCIRSRTGRSLGFDYKLTMIKLFMQKMIAQLFDDIPNDLCLILLGGPFLGKTEFFKRLLPPELQHLFSVQSFKGDKDSKRDAARYMLVLDDEFRGLKMATSEALKSQLSLTTINLRVPYGRKPHPFKRIASYCAVSNERFILKDPTGNRRLICLWVESIDWELYNSIDKVDLIMEAYHYYQMGYDHNLSQDNLKAINLVSKEFEISTSAEELMLQFLAPAKKDDSTAKWKPVSEIIKEINDTLKTKLTDYEVGKALRKLNYLHKYIDVNGSKLLCWLVKESDTKFANFDNDQEGLFKVKVDKLTDLSEIYNPNKQHDDDY